MPLIIVTTPPPETRRQILTTRVVVIGFAVVEAVLLGWFIHSQLSR